MCYRPGHAKLGEGLSMGPKCVCVHVQVPASRLGKKKQAVPPRGVRAMAHCPSGHSVQGKCYLSVVRGREGELHGEKSVRNKYSSSEQ